MHFQLHLPESNDTLSLGKIVCVGRNYAEHAQELQNIIPDEPLLFMKPSSAVQMAERPIQIPKGLGQVHFETEIAVLIDTPLKSASQKQAEQAIGGLGLALDLTLRNVQEGLKKLGYPWEKAKAFDGSCVLTRFVPYDERIDLRKIQFSLDVNGKRRQDGCSKDMLMPINLLLSYVSQWFTLYPGDVVLTGTPSGVGDLNSGDSLRFQLHNHLEVTTHVLKHKR